MKIAFTVYGEPVAKGRPRFFRRGQFVGTYTPKETEIAERDFKLQSLKHRPEQPLAEPVKLEIRVYRTIPKSLSRKRQELAEVGAVRPVTRPDWDNYAKLVCDAGNGIFWRDDSFVVECVVQKFFSANPRIEIVVETYSMVEEFGKQGIILPR